MAQPLSYSAAGESHASVCAHLPGCNMLGTSPEIMGSWQCSPLPEGCCSGEEPKGGAVSSLTSLSRLVSER